MQTTLTVRDLLSEEGCQLTVDKDTHASVTLTFDFALPAGTKLVNFARMMSRAFPLAVMCHKHIDLVLEVWPPDDELPEDGDILADQTILMPGLSNPVYSPDDDHNRLSIDKLIAAGLTNGTVLDITANVEAKAP